MNTDEAQESYYQEILEWLDGDMHGLRPLAPKEINAETASKVRRQALYDHNYLERKRKKEA